MAAAPSELAAIFLRLTFGPAPYFDRGLADADFKELCKSTDLASLPTPTTEGLAERTRRNFSLAVPKSTKTVPEALSEVELSLALWFDLRSRGHLGDSRGS